MSDRTIRILNEPLEGQAPGEDGEYLVADVTYRLRTGYILHVYYVKREKHDGYSTESFALFTSGKSTLLEQAPRFNQKRLDLYGAGNGGFPPPVVEVLERLKAEVLDLRTRNNERRQQEKAAFGKGA